MLLRVFVDEAKHLVDTQLLVLALDVIDNDEFFSKHNGSYQQDV